MARTKKKPSTSNVHAQQQQSSVVPIAVLVDLSGPKIRTGELKDDQPVKLTAGAAFTITTRSVVGDEHQVSTNYQDLPRVVMPGTRMLLDDGALSLIVESANDTDVVCRVIDGGLLGERKGINLPGVALPIDSLTPKDLSISNGQSSRTPITSRSHSSDAPAIVNTQRS